jgi:hypothetical protein
MKRVEKPLHFILIVSRCGRVRPKMNGEERGKAGKAEGVGDGEEVKEGSVLEKRFWLEFWRDGSCCV